MNFNVWEDVSISTVYSLKIASMKPTPRNDARIIAGTESPVIVVTGTDIATSENPFVSGAVETPVTIPAVRTANALWLSRVIFLASKRSFASLPFTMMIESPLCFAFFQFFFCFYDCFHTITIPFLLLR